MPAIGADGGCLDDGHFSLIYNFSVPSPSLSLSLSLGGGPTETAVLSQ